MGNELSGHRADFNEMDASYKIMQMALGGWIAQLAHAAAAFSFADHLHRAPMSAVALAKVENLDDSATFRLLRACASIGLVQYRADGTFATTPLLDTLRQDNPGSQRGMVLTLTENSHWAPWGRIVDVVRSGRSHTAEALGSNLFEYFSKTPGEEANFTSAMTSLTVLEAQEVARVLDMTGVAQACDVGGASGALLLALLAKDPSALGIVFDRPSVADIARKNVRSRGFEDRVQVVEGDFFEDVPESDLYLLKHILHDWNDEECSRILNNCRRRIRTGGRIAVIELIVGEVGEPGFPPLQDVNMLIMASGRERTFEEYKRLFNASGFDQVKLTAAKGSMPIGIFEARAV